MEPASTVYPSASSATNCRWTVPTSSLPSTVRALGFTDVGARHSMSPPRTPSRPLARSGVGDHPLGFNAKDPKGVSRGQPASGPIEQRIITECSRQVSWPLHNAGIGYSVSVGFSAGACAGLPGTQPVGSVSGSAGGAPRVRSSDSRIEPPISTTVISRASSVGTNLPS